MKPDEWVAMITHSPFDSSKFKPFPWWKRIIWRMFGTKSIGVDLSPSGCCTVVSYHYRGQVYIHRVNK